MDEILTYLKTERAMYYVTAFAVAVIAWVLLDFSRDLLSRAGYLRAVDALPETEPSTESGAANE